MLPNTLYSVILNSNILFSFKIPSLVSSNCPQCSRCESKTPRRCLLQDLETAIESPMVSIATVSARRLFQRHITAAGRLETRSNDQSLLSTAANSSASSSSSCPFSSPLNSPMKNIASIADDAMLTCGDSIQAEKMVLNHHSASSDAAGFNKTFTCSPQKVDPMGNANESHCNPSDETVGPFQDQNLWNTKTASSKQPSVSFGQSVRPRSTTILFGKR